MDKIRVVTDGRDPLNGPVLDYLARRYGMPAADIKALTLRSSVGDAQTITVELLVREDESL